MKKIFFALMAVAAIAIAGCNKPINDPQPPENLERIPVTVTSTENDEE